MREKLGIESLDEVADEPLVRGGVVALAALLPITQAQRVRVAQLACGGREIILGIEHAGVAELQPGPLCGVQPRRCDPFFERRPIAVGQLAAQLGCQLGQRRGVARIVSERRSKVTLGLIEVPQFLPQHSQADQGRDQVVPQFERPVVAAKRGRKVPLIVQQRAQSVMGFGVGSIAAQGMIVVGASRFLLFALLVQAGQIGVDACRAGRKLERALVPLGRLVESAFFLPGLSEVVERQGQLRIQLERRVVTGFGLFELSQLAEHVAQIVVGLGKRGRQLDRMAAVGKRLVAPVELEQQLSEVRSRFGHPRIEFHGATEASQRRRPISRLPQRSCRDCCGSGDRRARCVTRRENKPAIRRAVRVPAVPAPGCWLRRAERG